MSISAIDPTFVASTFPSIGGTGSTAAAATPATAPTQGTAATDATSGSDFHDLLLDGLDRLQGLQSTSSDLAVKAATGDLNAIHDYTVAATEASVATQLTVSLRNQAVGAFNEIMRMQV